MKFKISLFIFYVFFITISDTARSAQDVDILSKAVNYDDDTEAIVAQHSNFIQTECDYLVKEGIDIIIDRENNNNIEIPMSKPKNVLQLTTLLMKRLLERSANIQKQKTERNILMSKVIAAIQPILEYDNEEERDLEFCNCFNSIYDEMCELSKSCDDRLLEQKIILENLMFFMRLSAYNIKLNRYFNKHEDDILKRKSDLESIAKNINIVDLPEKLMNGLTGGVSIIKERQVGRSENACVAYDAVGVNVDLGAGIDVIKNNMLRFKVSTNVKKINEVKYLNAFSIANLQENVFSDRTYSKFKNLLTNLLRELSSLKANLYNLNFRLKSIGIIKKENDLAYYFDVGKYTTEYIKSLEFGNRVTLTSALLDSIGVESALSYRLSSHKIDVKIPDNIKNSAVILNNKNYALSLVRMFNSGNEFAKILNEKSEAFEKRIIACEI